MMKSSLNRQPKWNQDEEQRSVPLDVLDLICERISHTLRTPLSVCINLVDDHLAGYRLGEQDFTDSKSALTSIVQTLNSIRDFTHHLPFDPQVTSLQMLFREGRFASLSAESGILVIWQEMSNATKSIAVDRELVFKALRCILRYLSMRHRRNRAPGEPAVTIGHFSGEAAHASRLVVRAEQTGARDFERLRGTRELRHVAEIDQSIEALGLLFADEVIRLHGWRAYSSFENEGMIEIVVEF